MAREETRVLVVGAGPVGLALACDLARRGVACRVIDEEDGPTPPHESRALGVWERTLEILDDLGVIEPVLAQGKRLHGLNLFAGGRRLLHLGLDLDVEETPYPFLIALPQGQTERALLDRLRELGVEVEWRSRLETLEADDRGISAAWASAEGAGTVRADWVVGCDGARSAVRRALGVSFEGKEYEERFLLADLTLRWDVPDDEARVYLLPEGGALAAFPLPEPGRWRLIDASGSAEPEGPEIALERFRALLRDEATPPGEVVETHWTSGFRIHRRIAGRFRVGRCLLAGDAAHIHSPVGGQGMNTGIHDAYNLGWKLGLVLEGQAGDGLLDSYDAERRPVALGVLKGTDAMTRVITLRHPVTEALRNTALSFVGQFEFVRRRIARTLSELEIEYQGSPIVAEDRVGLLGALWHGGGPRPGDRAPDVRLNSAGRLFDRFRGTGHVLLLFEGREPDEPESARLDEIAEALAIRPGPSIRPWIVAIGERSGARVLPDPGGHIHDRYGAASACLYLIRPDGYVGYRSQPPSLERLEAYLSRTFGEGAGPLVS